MAKLQVTKYLTCHGAPEIHCLDLGDTGYRYDRVAVIPAYDETADFLDKLLQHRPENFFLLLILVINAPDTAPSENPSALAATRSMLDQLQRPQTLLWSSQEGQLQLHHKSANAHLLLVDRCTPGREIPARRGVGLARKIGADLACKLIDSGIINSHWIRTTDADVILPPDYWNEDFPASISAVTYPFEHRPCEHRYQLATALYELSLHWYVLGLQWAGSPYACHSIGSTLAVNYESYVKVRGFPQRSAGEDFYLLNKLVKIAPLYQPETPLLCIQGRPSARVPFGTGPALIKILAQKNPKTEFLFYHPGIFRLLKNWLSLLPVLWDTPGQSLHDIAGQIAGKGPDDLIGQHLYRVLSDLKVEQALAHALAHSSNRPTFLRHMHIWFDAFRTLKFIHGLRNYCLPSLPIEQAFKKAEFINNQAWGGNWIMQASMRLRKEIRSLS